MISNFDSIIRQYKTDSESVYNTWFINNEGRLKAFCSIRREVMLVIADVNERNSAMTSREVLLKLF